MRTSITTILAASLVSSTSVAQTSGEADPETPGSSETVPGTSPQAKGKYESDSSLLLGGSGLPIEHASRPIVLNPGTLRVDAAPPAHDISASGRIGGHRGLVLRKYGPGADVVSILSPGATYGIIDELEAGITLFPIMITPEFRYADVTLHGRYRLIDGDLELAGQLTLQIPAHTDFGFGLGVPVVYHMSDGVRLETGAELEVILGGDVVIGGVYVGGYRYYGDTIGTEVNLDVPVSASINLSRNLFVGGHTGLWIVDFDDVAIPIGAFGGYTLEGAKGPMMDITAGFSWPMFLTPTNSGDVLLENIWQINVGATVYLALPRIPQ